MWNAALLLDDSKNKAQSFFEDKRKCSDCSGVSFSIGQNPADAFAAIAKAKSLSKSGKIITYFFSSDDEFMSLETYSMDQFQ
jgi:hypothetical protein